MPDIQTVFGSINSIIDQATNSIVKIKEAQAQTGGKSPLPSLSTGSIGLGSLTGKEVAGLVGLFLVIGVIAYMVYKEGI